MFRGFNKSDIQSLITQKMQYNSRNSIMTIAQNIKLLLSIKQQ